MSNQSEAACDVADRGQLSGFFLTLVYNHSESAREKFEQNFPIFASVVFLVIFLSFSILFSRCPISYLSHILKPSSLGLSFEYSTSNSHLVLSHTVLYYLSLFNILLFLSHILQSSLLSNHAITSFFIYYILFCSFLKNHFSTYAILSISHLQYILCTLFYLQFLSTPPPIPPTITPPRYNFDTH